MKAFTPAEYARYVENHGGGTPTWGSGFHYHKREGTGYGEAARATGTRAPLRASHTNGEHAVAYIINRTDKKETAS